MAFLHFLDFLDFMETSEVAGPGPNPREIEISFGADGPLACARRRLLANARGPPVRAANILHIVVEVKAVFPTRRRARWQSTGPVL